MNKLVTGAIAGAAGIALLLGGAGTFALWNDAIGTPDAETVTTGALRFADDAVYGTWYDVTDGATPIDIEDFRMVPGDTLEFRANVTILAEGDNLTGTLSIDPTSYTIPDELDGEVSVLIVDGFGAATEITVDASDDGQTIPVLVQVHFRDIDPSNLEAGQEQAIDLTGLEFVLSQTTD